MPPATARWKLCRHKQIDFSHSDITTGDTGRRNKLRKILMTHDDEFSHLTLSGLRDASATLAVKV